MESNLPLHNTCEIAPLRKVLLRRGNLLPSAASNDVKGGGDA